MTFADLRTALGAFDADQPLVFTADGVPVRGGYHVTEFQQASVVSMTCDGTEDAWEEARIQLLDGYAGDAPRMAVGKFLTISKRVEARFPDLLGLPLRVEFAPQNRGLGIYQVDPPRSDSGHVVVPLTSGRAVCKPALTTSCCGAGQTACCA